MLGPRTGSGKAAVACPWESSHTTGRRFDSSTVLFGASASRPLGWFHCSHGHCVDRLQSEVIAALPLEARLEIEPADARTSSSTKTLEASTLELEQAIRNAPDGVSVVDAPCGMGKTRAARVVAAERASSGKRLFTKTAISVPTTALAVEQVEAFAAAGVTGVARVFGVLSVRRADGSAECRFEKSARHLARGGQSIPWELCEGRGRRPCEHAESCAAYGGRVGPKGAKIVVGPHELIGPLAAETGETGLLFVDEPPAVVTSERLMLADLASTETHLSRFEHRFAAAMAPALRAVLTWATRAELDGEGVHLEAALAAGVDQELLTEAYQATGADTAIEAVRSAFDPTHKGDAPPITWSTMIVVRDSVSNARAVGDASRVLRLLYLALTEPTWRARVELVGKSDERAIILTCGNRAFVQALTRDPGVTVIADAGGRRHLPVLERALGYRPPLVELDAPDGAPITRTVLAARATRSRWLNRDGELELSTPFMTALAAAVDWILEAPATTVGLITLAPVERALRAALGELVEVRELDVARAVLPPVLAPLRAAGVELMLGHYGAIRGLDGWKECDALVTLGDPWPRLTDAQHEAAYLGLERWEDRLEDMARAELEQAHGRLRTVHRKRAGRALHVGAMRPGGWPTTVEVRSVDTGGRPRNVGSVGPVLALADRLGRAGAARALGVSVRALQLWLAGSRHVPPEASRMAALALGKGCVSSREKP